MSEPRGVEPPTAWGCGCCIAFALVYGAFVAWMAPRFPLEHRQTGLWFMIAVGFPLLSGPFFLGVQIGTRAERRRQ